MVQKILGVILSIGVAQAGTTLITKVDSSGNQFTLYGCTHESIDFANGYVLVINRGFESTHILRAHSSVDQGSTWVDNGIAFDGMIGDRAYKATYPTIYGGEDGPYIFFPSADTGEAAYRGIVAIKGEGWGDTLVWGEPKRVTPSALAPNTAVGKQVGNGNVVVISVSCITDTLGETHCYVPYALLSSDLEEIENGMALDTTMTKGWFEGWDHRWVEKDGEGADRICGALWLDPSSHRYLSSDSFGEKWDVRLGPNVLPHPDSTPFGNVNRGMAPRHSQVAFKVDTLLENIKEVGNPVYIGALVPSDSSRDGILDPWYYSGEVYACPVDTITKHPYQVSKSKYHRALFSTIATGGGKVVAAWMEYTDSIIDTDADTNKTDLFYAVSKDGGHTWSEPENLTNTPDIIECWPRLAKRIDTLNQKAYLMFATALPDENLDIYYATMIRGAGYEQPIYINVATIDLAPPETLKVQEPPFPPLRELTLYSPIPNPFSEKISISYHLPLHTQVSLRVYNSMGALVKTLIDSEQSSGLKTLNWDGTDNRGNVLASGVYFCELRTSGKSEREKVILLH